MDRIDPFSRAVSPLGTHWAYHPSPTYAQHSAPVSPRSGGLALDPSSGVEYQLRAMARIRKPSLKTLIAPSSAFPSREHSPTPVSSGFGPPVHLNHGQLDCPDRPDQGHPFNYDPSSSIAFPTLAPTHALPDFPTSAQPTASGLRADPRIAAIEQERMQTQSPTLFGRVMEEELTGPGTGASTVGQGGPERVGQMRERGSVDSMQGRRESLGKDALFGMLSQR